MKTDQNKKEQSPINMYKESWNKKKKIKKKP